ncbi:hypothetical protein JW865_01905 [Candidatus Bathyarchaeota archaeon]|nr:hypothetical protein [Candidatus Bathyarchaeota archaeon]
MNDKTLGYLIMITTGIIMIGYFFWSFAPYLGTTFEWLIPYSEWAYKLPVIGAAYLLLIIVLWIGYTMATTPPPIPLENPLDLDEDEEDDEKTEDN